MDRRRELAPERLVYDHPKPGPGAGGALLLTPLQLLDRLAALLPPPRLHRHRCFGLAPNAPLRAAVTALALAAATAPPAAPPHPLGTEPALRRAARYAWARLLARIYAVVPLVCPQCGGEIRIIAFITDAPTVRAILTHPLSPSARSRQPVIT